MEQSYNCREHLCGAHTSQNCKHTREVEHIKNVGKNMKKMLKPKAAPLLFSKALLNCSPPPAKRRHIAFGKSERSSVNYIHVLSLLLHCITACTCTFYVGVISHSE